MQRVLIIGCGGAGKTVLARHLAEQTALPLIHLDAQYWKHGWVPSNSAEWECLVRQLIKAQAWIMDGNYDGTMAVRLPAADTIIFLDLPVLTCLWRVVKRRLRFARTNRPDLPAGCPERLTFGFLLYICRYRRRHRRRALARIESLAKDKRVIVLGTTAAVTKFMNTMSRLDAID